MKKLEKLRLKGNSEILSEKELKNVIGGSYGSGSNSSYGDGLCIATKNANGTDSSGAKCCSSADEAEQYAGASGWWCCNCSTAKALCS